jgi:uncharacterized protein YfaP (DUF2135 family)
MRYTARTVSIEWKADDGDARRRGGAGAHPGRAMPARTSSAAAWSRAWAWSATTSCTTAAAFADADARKRLLYRARYFDRIVD